MAGLFDGLMNTVTELADKFGLTDQLHQHLGELTSPQGISTLLAQAEQAGLGDKVRSWIGNGQNLPVSPDELRSILSNQQVQAMVDRTGLPASTLLPALAQFLPAAVNQQTPNGQPPAAG
ncbi:protein of unknown function DUF937 [Gluconacetobacter diazotrophicus PA1 5]|uniref:Uncharacterized protein n=2 Tax=Gluconacetobacter diazotrophicus TaxID=33996 RepID=A9HRJ8_GLUDA|nr:YidB family protein [Gluconacetobacter diazotrophicus]ACI53094.1 protein of unknown function DUF937 [Gluconacetobacter diazotrophicus PA1 5]MBB2155935.1 DUF937 domain-containing protein [Gluconacetobacter diazotrophicus]TWB07765.1 uncharacterized protein DUF937 [Gluconacetobacter diazotrophicus]CAP56926.1 conserved hypothetical protein [Gluconacetobacter diazotrophicus PA1 5]